MPEKATNVTAENYAAKARDFMEFVRVETKSSEYGVTIHRERDAGSWAAWRAYRIAKGLPTAHMDGRDTYMAPALWPRDFDESAARIDSPSVHRYSRAELSALRRQNKLSDEQWVHRHGEDAFIALHRRVHGFSPEPTMLMMLVGRAEKLYGPLKGPGGTERERRADEGRAIIEDLRKRLAAKGHDVGGMSPPAVWTAARQAGLVKAGAQSLTEAIRSKAKRTPTDHLTVPEAAKDQWSDTSELRSSQLKGLAEEEAKKITPEEAAA